MPTDEELFATFIQSSDPEIFGQLYDRFHDRLLSYLRRFFGDDPAPAEDVIQHAFMRVYEHRDQFDPAANFAGWLFSIANNCAIDEKRHAARTHRKAASFESMPRIDGDGMGFDPPATTQEASVISVGLEDHGRLRAALLNLEAQDRRLVEMVYFDGASYAEVSTALGWTTNNARVRLFRAVKFLKRVLAA